MNNNDIKSAIARMVENADNTSLRLMFEILSDFSRCTKHGKSQIYDEVSRVAAEDTEEAVLVTFPCKYRGKHEQLIEEIAQENRDVVLMKTMLEALELEKLKGANV